MVVLAQPVYNRYNCPNDFGDELVDHINISIESNSAVGRLLSPEFSRAFFYPKLGKFSSVFSLWAWLRDKNHADHLRNLRPDAIKRYLHTDNVRDTNYIKNFRAIIATATWMKFKNQPNVIKEIRELPDEVSFLFYTNIGNDNIRVSQSLPVWLIEIAQEITLAVKQNREPDFMFLASQPDEVKNSYTEGVLKEICSKIV